MAAREEFYGTTFFLGISRLFLLATALPNCDLTLIKGEGHSMVSKTLKNSVKTGMIFNDNEATQYLNSLICTVLYKLLAKIQDFSRTTFGLSVLQLFVSHHSWTKM